MLEELADVRKAAPSAPPSLLYLVHRVPYPLDKGDRIRNYHILRHLAGYAEVHLACLADEPVAAETLATLRKYCRQVAAIPLGKWSRRLRGALALAGGRTATEGAFHSPALRALVRDWASRIRFQACLVSASSLVGYLGLPELRGLPAIVDLVDVDSQKWLDYAAASRGPSAWLYRTEGRRLRALEKGLPSWARAVTLVSEAEARLYHQFSVPGPVHVISNGVDLTNSQPAGTEEEQACVFVGALDYLPNIEGVRWFCRDIWPSIHAERPGARVDLVGRRPVAAVRRLGRIPGVRVIGTVDDVRPYLARAAVTVVPLRIARGLQNKVTEALAMGKATVITPHVLAGLRAQPGTHLLTAASPAEWRQSVLRLLADRDFRKRLGQAGRRYVEEHHRWQQCLEPLTGLLGLQREHSGQTRTAGARC